eukprot:7608068-Heterocapsa_arctica.AAC.1
MDRADVQYAANEVCRVLRKVQKFDWLETPDKITAIVDTDYSGCLEARKSTSGGVLMHGSHCVRTWSTTQY